MLEFEVVQSHAMPEPAWEEFRALCRAAYSEQSAQIDELIDGLGAGTHVLARLDGVLVSHAMWVTRWLQPHGSRALMTAYIEFVATRPDQQGNGYATRVMQYLVNAIPQNYELSALSPANPDLYERLGWRFWRGPLYIRMPSGELTPTPDDRVMIFTLPGRPQLPLEAALSAEWRGGELW